MNTNTTTFNIMNSNDTENNKKFFAALYNNFATILNYNHYFDSESGKFLIVKLLEFYASNLIDYNKLIVIMILLDLKYSGFYAISFNIKLNDMASVEDKNGILEYVSKDVSEFIPEIFNNNYLTDEQKQNITIKISKDAAFKNEMIKYSELTKEIKNEIIEKINKDICQITSMNNIDACMEFNYIPYIMNIVDYDQDNNQHIISKVKSTELFNSLGNSNMNPVSKKEFHPYYLDQFKNKFFVEYNVYRFFHQNKNNLV